MLKVSHLAKSRSFSSCSAWYSKSDNLNSRLYYLLSNMPKEEPHLEDIRKVRMEKRTKRFLVQPSHIHWQVLGNGSYGAPASLLLHTEHRKYLFNCGEGTQRMTNQLSISGALAQLEHVFITSKVWKYLGGLPGLCLSARAAGAPDITIHGPPGCMDIYEATKGFVTLFEFDVHSYTEADGVFEDGAVRVEHIKLPRTVNKKCPNLPGNWKGDEQGEWIDYDNTVQAYICHFRPKPGKLDVNKCIEKGVKPGPMLGLLKSGKDVTLDDGTIVRSNDVVGDTAPPSNFVVLDIPEMEYLDSLERNEKLKRIKNLQTVFHFSPQDVVTSDRYKKWIKEISMENENINHVLMNESCRGLGLPDVSSYCQKLRTIKEEFFPSLLGANDTLANADVKSRITFDKEEFDVVAMQGVAGLRINVRPSSLDKIDYNEVVRYNEELTHKEMMEGFKITDPKDKEEYIKKIQEDVEYAKNFNPDPVKSLAAKLAVIDGVKVPNSHKDNNDVIYPVVTFLGTGSSVPSKYRNVSSILVETSPDSYLILDCGEGTISQLVRLLGKNGAEKVLMGLKGVYISHMHADHHLGLINIIQHREKAFKSRGRIVKNMYIISTGRLAPFLTYYHSKFEPILTHAELVKCEHLILYNSRDENTLVEDPSSKHQLIFPSTLQTVLSDLGLKELYTSRAIHCPHAFCLALRTDADFKLAYSGDTRPCEYFRDICTWGGSPDLLIHEATMEHYMAYDAIIKKHSTFTEAINEGVIMGAKFTMLTHFSQRYAKMPTLEEIKGKPNVGIAFDNMVVRPDNLKMIPSIYPALARFLWDYQEELDERAEQYKSKYSEGSGLSGQMELEDFQSAFAEKKELAEKLEKRYENKHQWFLKVNKRKLDLEKQEAEASKDSKSQKRL